VRASSHESHHPGARLPEVVRGAQDAAGELEAGHVALARRRRIGAAELVEVGVVKAGGLDRDQNLPGPRDGVGEVADARNGLARVADRKDRPHAGSVPQ
jgi:hypothetical protein